MKPLFFDIHSHLDFNNDREEVIAEMKKQNVWTATVGVDIETSKKAVLLAERHDNLFATIGFHPHDNLLESFDEKEFEKLVAHKKVVAIGECGLDYSKLFLEGQPGGTRELSLPKRSASRPATPATSEKARQKTEFEKQIDFAVKHGKPLMIHCRDAYPDIIDILKSKQKTYGEKVRGNFHFFTSPIEIAKQCLEIGFSVSFTGPITFTSQYDDVVRYVPIERMMAETDAPFASPAPFRGKRNSPLHVQEIAKAIARIKGEDFEKVRSTLVDNSFSFFSL